MAPILTAVASGTCSCVCPSPPVRVPSLAGGNWWWIEPRAAAFLLLISQRNKSRRRRAEGSDARRALTCRVKQRLRLLFNYTRFNICNVMKAHPSFGNHTWKNPSPADDRWPDEEDFFTHLLRMDLKDFMIVSLNAGLTDYLQEGCATNALSLHLAAWWTFLKL